MDIISHEQVIASGISDPSTAQRIIEDTFIQKFKGTAVCAQEIAMIPNQLEQAAFYSLPAYLTEQGIAGIKWTSHVAKSAPQQQYTHPVVILNDLHTGAPIALVDGYSISSLRTAAVTATAIKYIADTNSTSLLVCGSGHQAKAQIRGVLPFLPKLKELHIWSRQTPHAEVLKLELADELDRYGVSCTVHAELPSRLDFAEIIIGATSASTPYLTPSHFVNGHLYIHIGMKDIEGAAIEGFDGIVCDDFDAGVAGSSQSLFHHARSNPNIRQSVSLLEHLIVGQATVQQHAEHKMMFNGFGLSIFDLALADAVVKRQRKERL